MDNKNTQTAEEFAAACQTAQNNITEALKILSGEPAIMNYFSLLSLEPVNDPEIQVRLATKTGSSVAGLEYNPNFINRLDDPSELALIFFAEALRVALHHPTTRFRQPVGCNFLASNLICFEDQHVLSKWRDSVKGILHTIPNYTQVKEILDSNGFNKATDWTLEKIFVALMKEWRKQQDQMKDQIEQQMKSGAGKNPDDQQGQGGTSTKGQKDKDQKNGQGQPQESEGEGEGQDSQDQNGNGAGNNGNNIEELMKQLDQMQRNAPDLRKKTSKEGQSDAASALEEYFDSSEKHAKKMAEKWGENDVFDEKITEITNHIASDVSRWGNLSGMLKQIILEANTPKFDPTTVIKHFKQEIQSEEMESTRSKTNRRFGNILPGWRHKMKSSVLFAIDCSGSMSDEDVGIGEAFVNKFIKHSKVSYCFWDGQCGEITDLKKKEKNFELIGRGCTNPQCVIEKLEAEKLNFGGLIFFTDNGFDWDRPKGKWAKKIFIISTKNACEPPAWVKYHLSLNDIKEYNNRQNQPRKCNIS